ncbi:MAG: response regulator transcription factor [Proteobacteria bacterium]|nr:response regulator transcription factor [Pseudomonadota bacterium]
MIRIALADDHAIVRTGFRALIEEEPDMAIVAECDSADAARAMVAAHVPDVLAFDIAMPGGGLSLVPDLRASMPELRLLCLSMHDREPYVFEALRRGVHGYVTKGAATDELVAAIRAVCAGEVYLSSDLEKPRPSPEPALESLSERERAVFLLTARGAKPKQVAMELGISDKTAYLHRATVYAKLGARNELELHQIALERGLL